MANMWSIAWSLVQQPSTSSTVEQLSETETQRDAEEVWDTRISGGGLVEKRCHSPQRICTLSNQNCTSSPFQQSQCQCLRATLALAVSRRSTGDDYGPPVPPTKTNVFVEWYGVDQLHCTQPIVKSLLCLRSSTSSFVKNCTKRRTPHPLRCSPIIIWKQNATGQYRCWLGIGIPRVILATFDTCPVYYDFEKRQNGREKVVQVLLDFQRIKTRKKRLAEEARQQV
jgi:hypothetical protein